MDSNYQSDLLLAWLFRVCLYVNLVAIYIMVSGCSHKFDVNGTSSGNLSRDPPVAADTTLK